MITVPLPLGFSLILSIGDGFLLIPPLAYQGFPHLTQFFHEDPRHSFKEHFSDIPGSGPIPIMVLISLISRSVF